MSNYTTAQEATLKASTTPITYAMAVEFADEFGRSPQSVISKVLSLEIPYECKPKPAKRPKGKTKAELVAEIAGGLGVAAVTLAGLEKATAGALANLAEVTITS
jgi:hypothetical protein